MKVRFINHAAALAEKPALAHKGRDGQASALARERLAF